MALKPLIQSSLRQDYRITHPYHRLRLWLEGLRSKDKIVIYQMSKVGSTTIWKSLESLNLDIPIYHVHTLRHEQISRAIERDKANFPKLRFMYPETIHSEYLRSQLDQKNIMHPWSVITLVRDPVAKILSSFFQNLEREFLLGLDYRKKIKVEGDTKVLPEVIERFYQEKVDNSRRKHPFEWFNFELKDNLDFDIFAAPSIAGSNYYIYNTKLARILLLKLESLNDSYQSAFQEFLGLQNANLVQANVGLQKRYKSLYKSFLRNVDLPVDYLDEIYQTELVRHFYSESEIEQFYQRWTRS
ncbi:putative capsular polysaccharide synthesis family protein [Coleofasciculus sp. F4-SAH-05]|uniref:putative capsular polysaccharide synthesis family protein n=1 Tax=Coleofasciculus sp. F4-SAH-05 TaxID=3069525 RepID=UPI0032FDA8D2